MNTALQRLSAEFSSGKISRRDLAWRASGFLGGTALAGFLMANGISSVEAASLLPGASRASKMAQGDPKSGGTFTMAITADPILNPLVSSGVHSVMVNKVLFNGLTRPEPGTLQPVPDLAESWESNEDLTQWTFKLREDVKWHDGEPFTADDVIFTYDRRVNEPGLTLPMEGFESVEKVDDYTVTFHLDTPLGHFPTLMTYLQQIVPKHVLEGHSQVDYTEFSKGTPIGTGPYKVVEFNAGNYVVTEKNPDYFLGEPYIDQFVFKVLPDVNSQVAQLRTNEISFVTVEPSNVSSLEGQDQFVIDVIDYVNHYYVAYQLPAENTLVGKALFEEPQVRLAFSHAIDRQAIVDQVLQGYGIPATGTIPTALDWAYNHDLEPHAFDQERSLELLAEVGWEKNGDGILERDGEKMAFTLSLSRGNPAQEQIATIVHQYLSDLGCEVELETTEWATFSAERWLGERYDGMYMWWITPPDPDQYRYYGCEGVDNHMNFCDPEISDVLVAARETADPEERRDLYYRYQELQMENPPVTAIYYPKEIRVFPRTLQGVPNIGIRDVLIYANEMWFDQ